MDYNTERKKLFLPEYGRNVQQMVDYALTIEDRDQRNLVARSIIAVMGTLMPLLRDQVDFKHKLWDHLAIMSDFKLDIDSPYPTPLREKTSRKTTSSTIRSFNIKAQTLWPCIGDNGKNCCRNGRW